MSTKLETVNLENSTAVAPLLSDNSAAVVTSAWVKALLATGSISGNGWLKIGPIYLQWGIAGSVASQPAFTTVSFPINFPSACFSVVATTLGDIASSHNRITYIDPASISASSFNVSNNGSGAGASWIAIGN